MKDFDQLIKEDIAGYHGEQESLIIQAPAFYRLMTNVLSDPSLPGRLRPLVMAAIAYFTLPADIMPEDLQGPAGYADDIFLCALVAEQLRVELGSGEILESNWDGGPPVLDLLAEILAKERELIGDRRDLILWYVGYEHLLK